MLFCNNRENCNKNSKELWQKIDNPVNSNIKAYNSVLKVILSLLMITKPIACESKKKKKFFSVRKSAQLLHINFPRSGLRCSQIDLLLDVVFNLLSSWKHSCSEGKTTNDLQIYYFKISKVIFIRPVGSGIIWGWESSFLSSYIIT